MSPTERALFRAACANFVSETSAVCEAINRVAGDYKQALYFRARAVVMQDRGLREFDDGYPVAASQAAKTETEDGQQDA